MKEQEIRLEDPIKLCIAYILTVKSGALAFCSRPAQAIERKLFLLRTINTSIRQIRVKSRCYTCCGHPDDHHRYRFPASFKSGAHATSIFLLPRFFADFARAKTV